ncbi:MAG: DUF2892 domain-containing protein [Chitinophagaceae bacterium]|nr:MAG: DUF2892 domain-containing protein [Chitinophagaceae bacterium]
MKPNISTPDRAFRIIIGISVAAAGIYFQSWWGLLAIVPLATAAISFCPLYRLFTKG